MLGLIFKILGGLYKLYPIKLLLNKRIESYFINYHVSQILREASHTYTIGKYSRVIDLTNQPPLRGMLCEYVRVGDFYPTPKDLAVAINISISAYCNEEYINKSDIIDLAFHLSHEIKARLITDPLLKNVCDDLNKNVDEFSTSADRHEIEFLFSNKKSLFTAYYSTFEKSEFSYSIKVWHQSQENEYIEWAEKDAITIHLNPMRIREGFFQIGFDYYCNQSKEGLILATRTDGYEIFNGNSDGKIVWAH